MDFFFHCFGHENVTARHRNTVEFTKEADLRKEGDCILGVRADFDYNGLLKFVKEMEGKRIVCEISIGDYKDKLSFIINQSFCDEEEIVIRKTDFLSSRTLGILADKAAIDLKRELVKKANDKKAKITIGLYEEKDPK